MTKPNLNQLFLRQRRDTTAKTETEIEASTKTETKSAKENCGKRNNQRSVIPRGYFGLS